RDSHGYRPVSDAGPVPGGRHVGAEDRSGRSVGGGLPAFPGLHRRPPATPDGRAGGPAERPSAGGGPTIAGTPGEGDSALKQKRTVVQLIAPDVKVGKNFKILVLLNLYGCRIDNHSQIRN